MNTTRALLLLLPLVGTVGCTEPLQPSSPSAPAAAEGEGEGDAVPGEGEGDLAAGEGEGEGEGDVAPGEGEGEGEGDANNGEPLALPCVDALGDVYVVPAGLPPFDASRRGDVVRCAVEGSFSAADVDSLARNEGYVGAPLTSGTTVLRIAYRTERLGGAGGIGNAFVFLPEIPRAAQQPIVVAGHGTVGVGPGCAPSREGFVDHSFGAFAFAPLAGAGWLVVAPDYAGYADATPGYLLSEDVAHSVLDASRAARALLNPALVSGDVVILGHSQGGHAALSAHAQLAEYGAGGDVVGVIALAPAWFAFRSFGAMLSSFSGYDTAEDADAISMAMYYFYSHAEVYDGPGAGLSLFRAEQRDALHTLLTTQCWSDVPAGLPALGERPVDFFEQSFVSSVSACSISGFGCGSGPASTWFPRMAADRPSVDPHGPPIVLVQTGEDEVVSPALAQCGIDQIEEDLAPPSSTSFAVCADAVGDHNTPITHKMDWINQWIAARTLGEPEPPACPGAEVLDASCPGIPPNQDD